MQPELEPIFEQEILQEQMSAAAHYGYSVWKSEQVFSAVHALQERFQRLHRSRHYSAL